MSNTVPIDDVLKRVERVLDALDVPDQSSKEFRDLCDQLETYLNDQKASLMVGGALLEPQKCRLAAIIERLAGLQKRAQTRANIVTGLQKHIAEQLD